MIIIRDRVGALTTTGADCESALPAGLEIRGELPAEAERVISKESLLFVSDLVRRFRPHLEKLLERRRQAQRSYDSGKHPAFSEETLEIRDRPFTVAPLPPGLLDRRVQINGPADRKSVVTCMNSGATAFVADLENSTSPTFSNIVTSQLNLKDAILGTIEYRSKESDNIHRLKGHRPVVMLRPRGWHQAEKHVLVDGQYVSAALWDFGLFFSGNVEALLASGTGPYFYLSKLENHTEARLWSDVFSYAEEGKGLPRGTIRATCLIDALPAAFEMDEILWELREHSSGLHCGFLDYVFSFVKTLRRDPRALLTDRSHGFGDDGFLRSYERLLIETCHRRGVHALGGVSAQIPNKDDLDANETLLASVRSDKLRQVKEGFDGTWVAHRGLVPIAKAIFDRHMKGPNQITHRRGDAHVNAEDLLRPPSGPRTEGGLRHDIRVSVRYLEAWLLGQGSLPLYHFMADASTLEVCRSLVWQWIHHGATLEDSRPLTVERFRTLLAEEMDRIRLEVGDAHFKEGRFEEARALFERIATQAEFTEFATIPAYQLLEADMEERSRVRSHEAAQPSDSPAPKHSDPRRWEGIVRRYTKEDVEKLRGTVAIAHTLASLGANRLWDLLHSEPYVHALGALTGNQAVQMVKAGLKAIYLSGWQVAADANSAAQTYPDQSLYPANSVPEVVRRINRALERADQIEHSEGNSGTYFFAPIVADAEAGFGGPLNAFELMKAMIEAGAAAVHFEDQVASEKKCGHLGGKVLVPTSTFVRTLTAARLAADVLDVPTLLIARTDAEGAKLLMSDIDPYDAPFIEKGQRTSEGFYRMRPGIDTAIARGLAYAPYADLVWCETQTPDLHEAKRFADGIHEKFPLKLLAYNCSPSFNWKKHLDDSTIAKFQRELGAMGYKFQFVTLAGFHALNHSMFDLAHGYRDRGMAAYTELQTAEFASERHGYTATRHQREVGTGYFDLVATAVSGGQASTLALEGSTEAAQFTAAGKLGATHAAEQVKAALYEDHGRLEALVGRVREAKEAAAMGPALNELHRMLTEHFAHEEHSKGFYGLLKANSPEYRAEVAHMIDEHKELLSAARLLVDQAKAPAAFSDLAREAGSLCGRLIDHEQHETKLADLLR